MADLELQSLAPGIVLVEVLLQEFVEDFQELLGGTLLRSSSVAIFLDFFPFLDFLDFLFLP